MKILPVSLACFAMLAACQTSRKPIVPSPERSPFIDEPIELITQNCWVITATLLHEDGTKEVFGPFYSLELPCKDETSGDSTFTNLDTGRLMTIPGQPEWSISIDLGHRLLVAEPHEAGK